MERVAALLAAVVSIIGLAACGDGGAEPGASREATLVLDFQPNAVHAGIYAAGDDLELEVREPSASTDAPKLLAAARADFAILDINDLAIALERGLELELVDAIADRPLAAVITTDPEVKRPRDLEGRTVGVTGLPSDEAVLDSVVAADGGDPGAVKRVTIGFDSVAALSAHRVAAATAFWNAEGVALRELGLPVREFRVDDYGAPRYPELVLVTTPDVNNSAPELVASVRAALEAGYGAVSSDPASGLDHLLDANPGLDPDVQAAQLRALVDAGALPDGEPISRRRLDAYGVWAARHGIVKRPPPLTRAGAAADSG